MATLSLIDPEQTRKRAAEFRKLDADRQEELEALLEEYIKLKTDLVQVRNDLDDERNTKRHWRQRADEAEAQINRKKFVLVLVDGDGYKFKADYLKMAENGGARAAEQLLLDVQSYIKANEILTDDYEVMVNIYANKSGLSTTLVNEGILRHGQLDAVFQTFTQAHSLFNFIDSGPGKERADAKLRDTYNFFSMNPQCRHIFLMCSHDQGYLTELTKINNAAATKTTLVHGASVAKAYSNLQGFTTTKFNVFEDAPSGVANRAVTEASIRELPATQPSRPTTSNMSTSISATAPTFSYSSAASAAASNNGWQTKTTSTSGGRLTPPDFEGPSVTRSSTARPAALPASVKGIAVNRNNERIDLPLRPPNARDNKNFADRIDESRANLCNDYHLLGDCQNYYRCTYDHHPIDDSLRNTLRNKARNLPCPKGTKCRRLDCYMGHHCPGRDRCLYGERCNFYKAGLHIDDLEVARIIAAPPA